MSGSDFDVIRGLTTATVRRQEMLSNNLANIETKNYVRQDIDFGSVLNGLANESGFSGDTSTSVISRSTYRDYSNPVTLESELSKLYENHLRYILLTRQIGHNFEHMKKALEVRGQ